MHWPIPPDWNSPAGKLISQLANAIPPDRATPIMVFGSAALQLTVAPVVPCAVVLITPDMEYADNRMPHYPHALSRAEIISLAAKIGLLTNDQKPSLFITAPFVFDASPHYVRRAQEVTLGNALVTIPHPLDILISKLHYLDKEDVQAFRCMQNQHQYPTPEIFIEALRQSVSLFRWRPKDSRIFYNVPRIGKLLWKRTIDMNRAILDHALVDRDCEPGLKEQFRKIGKKNSNPLD